MKNLMLVHFLFLETICNNLFKSLIITSSIMIFASPLISGFFGRSPEAVSIDMSLAVTWMALLFYIIFYVSQELSVEKNKAKISIIMSRPLSYENYIISKTISLILGAFLLILALFVCSVLLYLVYPYIIGYETRFKLNLIIISLSFVSCLIFSIGTISFVSLISSKLDTTLFIVASTIFYMLICNGIPVVINILGSVGGGYMSTVLDFSQLLFPNYSAIISIANVMSLSIVDNSELIIQFIINIIYILLYSTSMICISYFAYVEKEVH